MDPPARLSFETVKNDSSVDSGNFFIENLGGIVAGEQS